MKKIFITILLAALMPFAAGAQDARQRTAETIVADALAQLPAQTPKAFDSLMQELAATGADGIRMMAAMLVPAAEGKNAPVEYAINGVVSYVTAAGREELAREIRAGLTDAVAASTDKPNQAFLLSQLQLCATAAEAPVFVKYAADEYLADYAVRGLISTPGTDGEILALIDASPAPDALLAYAAAEKRLAAAEPALLKWAADPKAGTPTKEAVYNALAKCGTAASIAPLAAAAKADGYAFTKTDATGAYVALLARLAAAGNSKAVAAAKALRKTGMPQNVRAAGLGIVLGTDAKKQTPELLAALKDADREYRCAALDFAGDFADDALRRAGAEFTLTADPALLRGADKVILPGVGEASSAMSQLRERGLDTVIPSLTQPVLGICIGMQLMCLSSEEGDARCMGIFPTQVLRLPATAADGARLKVPHVGWNTITSLRSPLFDETAGETYVYYVHSFAAEPCAATIATTDYGRPFSAALGSGNFFGTQFHPEKSGAAGARILLNFLNL